MSRTAKVQDIGAMRDFRSAMMTFADKASNAIGEADGEVQRVSMWLENEATAYWTSELRKRQAAVMKAKEDLRFKQIFKSPSGGKASTVDEEKALAVAQRRYEEAEQKNRAVSKWIRQLHKESHQYRGAVQRLATTVAVDVPNAAAKILRMITSLEGYVALSAPSVGPAVEGSSSESGMARGGEAPEIGGGHKRYRKLTPDAKAKDAAKPAGPDMESWSAGDYAKGDAEAVDKIPGDRVPVDPASIVIVGVGTPSARRIYLERVAGSFPGDSGWYIGPAEAVAAAEIFSMRTELVLKARPHLANLLTLPVGTLAVIDGAGIASVLNASDEDMVVKGAAPAAEAPPAAQAPASSAPAT